MGIVSRLRYYVHAKHDAAKNLRPSEADSYTAQIASIQKRAELIRRAFMFALLALARHAAVVSIFGAEALLECRSRIGGDCFRAVYDLATRVRRLLHPRGHPGAEVGTRRGSRPS